jgi:enoyl-[acyl-carrier protein] reductase I
MHDLMKGKRGLIMGVANDHSIAWGIAKTLAAQAPSSPSPIRARRSASASSRWRIARRRTGAALRRRGHRLGRCGVRRRSRSNGARSISWSTPSRFSDKNELKGRYADTTRENFVRTMVISCFSFTEAAKRAAS